MGSSGFWGCRCCVGGVASGLRRIVGEAVGFTFVDVASRLWLGCRRPAGVFLRERSMRLRPWYFLS